jgi:hypothetical protein
VSEKAGASGQPVDGPGLSVPEQPTLTPAHAAYPAGTPPTRAGALRSAARLVYRWALLAFLLAGGVQIFLAGLGVFSFGDHDVAGGTSAFDAHKTLGFTLAGVAIIIFLLALIARAGALPLVLCGVLVVQTSLLQSLLAGLADNTALFGGLHALDGLLVLGIAGFLYATSRRHR